MYTNCKGEQHIDYIIRANVVPIWFFIVVVIVAFTSRILTKKWSVGLFFGYALIILGETVLFRTAIMRQYFQPQLFWSYVEWANQKEQILANVLMFVPFGLIVGQLWKWGGVLVGSGLSISIELYQLISHRGLFEFDDIIHNTLGTMIGIAIYMISAIIYRKVITDKEVS